MKKAGMTLISLSFLAGAYLAVLDERSIDWPWFSVIFIFGVIGVVMARMGSRAAATSVEELESNLSTVRDALDNIVDHVSCLYQERDGISTYDMSAEIDARVLDDLNNFVASREAITHVFGLQAYASVMTPYAGGERYLNRVWSASADGYVDEVNDYLERSLAQFTEARDTLRLLEKDAESQLA